GNWTFVAQAPGYAPEGGKMAVRSGSPNPPISFQLVRRGVLMGPLGGITEKDLENELASADALFDQKKWDDAINSYRALIDKTPALSVLNLQIAAAYRNKGDYERALAAYNGLLKVDPANQSAWLGIASTNMDRGDQRGAEEALTKAAAGPGAGRGVFDALG